MPTKHANGLALLALTLFATKAIASNWDGCVNAYWPCNPGEVAVAYKSESEPDGDEEDPQNEIELSAVIFDHELNELATAPMQFPYYNPCHSDSTPNGNSPFTNGWDMVCSGDNVILVENASNKASIPVYTGCYAWHGTSPYCPGFGGGSVAYGIQACCPLSFTTSQARKERK